MYNTHNLLILFQILEGNFTFYDQDDRRQNFNMDIIFSHFERVPQSKGTRRGWIEVNTNQWRRDPRWNLPHARAGKFSPNILK